MHISKVTSLLSVAAVAAANSVTFVSLDAIDRTIYFTPNAGLQTVPAVTVPGGDTVQVNLPEPWIGNFYSVSDGAANVPGMLGEVAFNTWAGLSFYDISAIVNPSDIDGVHEIFPTDDPNEPRSGCVVFPCDTAYWHPDDIQTQSAPTTDFTCTLGTAAAARREAVEPQHEYPVFPRHFVERSW